MSEASENSFGGRVRRYAQVSGTVAGQAARFAGRRFFGGGGGIGDQGAAELRAALGGLKGPLMKVAQLMATIPEALPSEYAAELAQLQSNAPPMGKPFVRRRMRTELGADWEKRFKAFPLDAAAAASLGQVHKATLLDGTTAACKLQYPNIASAVDADLNQLKLLFSIYRRYDSAIQTDQIYEELAERLREELDYRLEARNMRLYKDMLANEPHVHVAEVVEPLSTGRLLTMGWLDGAPLLSFKDGDQETRNKIALNLFRAWYVPFYHFGVIHGDPHLGNYSVRENLDINLLDFGCIRIFPPRFVKGVIDLYRAVETGNRDLAREAYHDWGFENLNEKMVDILNEWASFLYAPLLEDRPRLIQETNSGNQGRKVAEGVYRRLKEVGGVRPPREFVFMDRAAVGLGSVFLHLKAEINWHRLFMDLIEDFDAGAMAARQKAMLERHGIAQPD
ncbi:MAG: AarF/ABC1/UbiB kinase family protein [Geminicoccaceae bacterium]|nr:AarF/ABC1/UbiB kinase family protein [Geminicoccaceae bacterium]